MALPKNPGILLAIPLLLWSPGSSAQVEEGNEVPHELSELHRRETFESFHQPEFSGIDLSRDSQEIEVELEDPGMTDADAADRIVAGLESKPLRALAREVLERNPAIAAAKAQAMAAAEVPAQARSLPDPMFGVTPFIQSPETRVGPQKAMGSISQRIPWPGKLSLRERAASRQADAAWAVLEARRLALVTEVRRLAHELSFLDAWAGIVRSDRETLIHYEVLARTRYAAGIGAEQAVVKIQTEITKDDHRLLDIATRRSAVVASINGLRNRPQQTPVVVPKIPEQRPIGASFDSMRQLAVTLRPEIRESDARIESAAARVELAGKEYRPDLTAGLSYTFVGDRNDPAGRASPPPDNGDDVVALTFGINLPVWRDRLDAGVEESMRTRQAAEESKRNVITGIESSLGDLTQRLDLLLRQLELFEDVLIVQAEQALASAEAGYSAGTMNALDLLDAERVLLDVRTSTARAHADYAIALARLEGTMARPIAELEHQGETSHE